MSENVPDMKLDVSALIGNWGKRCTVSRLSISQNAAGRMSGTYASVASGTFIIEPYSKKGRGGGGGRADPGFLDETSHVIFGRYGVNVQAEDRVFASGESFFYDVLNVNPNNGVHAEIYARQVKRT